MDRRAFLAATGSALVGVLGGCQADTRASPPPDEVRVIDLRYQNWDRRPCRLHVLLLEDGDPVYWTTKDVVPAERQDDGSLLVQARPFEGYPTEPAPCVLHTRLEQAPPSDWATTEFEGTGSVSGDPAYLCVETEIRIRNARSDLQTDFGLPDSDAGSC